MIINIKLDFDPETQQCKVVKTEVEKTPPSVRITESDEPQIILDAGKYSINAAAAELMKVEPGARIDIKYQVVDLVECPIIGTEEAFGSGGGNKLTKAMTISYRGKANERLARFGNTFSLTPLKGSEGLFVLIGDNMPEAIEVPDEIEIKEDLTNHEDLVDIDNDPLSFDDDFATMEDAELITDDDLKFN